jgi:hypothetical protein
LFSPGLFVKQVPALAPEVTQVKPSEQQVLPPPGRAQEVSVAMQTAQGVGKVSLCRRMLMLWVGRLVGRFEMERLVVVMNPVPVAWDMVTPTRRVQAMKMRMR